MYILYVYKSNQKLQLWKNEKLDDDEIHMKEI